MNKYKVFSSVFALLAILMPAVSFADGKFYYGNVYLNEAPPTLSTGYYLDQNSNGSVVNSGTTVNTGSNDVNVSSGSNGITDIFGINIKSKAERDAEKLAKEKAEAEAAENARVARNNDGTFAYGYTNGDGAQYLTGAKYVDARNSGNRAYSTASAGFLPNTILGWFAAIVLISVLIYFVRKIKQIEEEKKKKLLVTTA